MKPREVKPRRRATFMLHVLVLVRHTATLVGSVSSSIMHIYLTNAHHYYR
jgi:hypothetical protein